MTIYEKLGAIQKDLFVPKEKKNDFGGFKYRSCEDILKTVKPLCEANKTVLILTAGLEALGDDRYIRATVTLRDLESDASISVDAYAREERNKKGMDASQVSGTATSYARKYALAGLFGIDNEKDSDITNTKDKNGKEATAKEQVIAYFNRHPDIDKNWLIRKYSLSVWTDINETQAEDFIKRTEKGGCNINE